MILDNDPRGDELQINIGRFDKVKTRFQFDIMHNNKKVGIGEVERFDGQASTLVTYSKFEKGYFNEKDSYVKHKGRRSIGNWGFALGRPSDSVTNDFYYGTALDSYFSLFSTMPINVYLFGKPSSKIPRIAQYVQPGFEFNLGAAWTLASVPYYYGDYSWEIDYLTIVDLYILPSYFTVNFFYRTWFSPYVGLGATYYYSTVSSLDLEPEVYASEWVPTYTFGINLFRNKSVTLNFNVKIFPMYSWDGLRMVEDSTLAVPTFAVLFNF